MTDIGFSELNLSNPVETIRQQIKQIQQRPVSEVQQDKQNLIFSALTNYVKPMATRNKTKPKKYEEFDVGTLTPSKIEHVKMTRWTNLIDKLIIERNKEMDKYYQLDYLGRFE